MNRQSTGTIRRPVNTGQQKLQDRPRTSSAGHHEYLRSATSRTAVLTIRATRTFLLVALLRFLCFAMGQSRRRAPASKEHTRRPSGAVCLRGETIGPLMCAILCLRSHCGSLRQGIPLGACAFLCPRASRTEAVRRAPEVSGRGRESQPAVARSNWPRGR